MRVIIRVMISRNKIVCVEINTKGTQFLLQIGKFPPAFWTDGNRFFRMLQGRELCFLRTDTGPGCS